MHLRVAFIFRRGERPISIHSKPPLSRLFEVYALLGHSFIRVCSRLPRREGASRATGRRRGWRLCMRIYVEVVGSFYVVAPQRGGRASIRPPAPGRRKQHHRWSCKPAAPVLLHEYLLTAFLNRIPKSLVIFPRFSLVCVCVCASILYNGRFVVAPWPPHALSGFVRVRHPLSSQTARCNTTCVSLQRKPSRSLCCSSNCGCSSRQQLSRGDDKSIVAC